MGLWLPREGLFNYERDPLDSINRDLVSWWPLEDGRGGIVRDIGPAQNHGTLNNFVNYPWVSSPYGGQALAFDGVNDFVKGAADTPAAPVITNNVSIFARFRTGSSQNAYAEIAGRTHSSTHTSPYYAFSIGLNYTSDGKFYGGINNTNVLRAFSYAANTPYDVLYTYDGTRQTLCVNGNVVGSDTAVSGAIAYGSGGFVSIGANAGGGENCTGQGKDVRIWKRTLSLPEAYRLTQEGPLCGSLQADQTDYRAIVAAGSFVPAWAQPNNRAYGGFTS